MYLYSEVILPAEHTEIRGNAWLLLAKSANYLSQEAISNLFLAEVTKINGSYAKTTPNRYFLKWILSRIGEQVIFV